MTDEKGRPMTYWGGSPAAPEPCGHDVRFKGVFDLPREDNGCLACALERTILAHSLAQTEIKGHMRVEDDLQARIAELETDAARYRWLRDSPYKKAVRLLDDFHPDALDAALDAALKDRA